MQGNPIRLCGSTSQTKPHLISPTSLVGLQCQRAWLSTRIAIGQCFIYVIDLTSAGRSMVRSTAHMEVHFLLVRGACRFVTAVVFTSLEKRILLQETDLPLLCRFVSVFVLISIFVFGERVERFALLFGLKKFSTAAGLCMMYDHDDTI